MILALSTLEKLPGLYLVIVRMTAFRALEAIGPPIFEKPFTTLFFGAICLKKFGQAVSFLKLYWIFRHVITSQEFRVT